MSLKNINIDSILWYHSYCGECDVLRKEPVPIEYSDCSILTGYTLTYNAIIYKQYGKYFILNFDCKNLVIKRELNNCKSVQYFISIIPILNERSKAIKAMHRKGIYLPYQVDGGFEDADIYFNKVKKHVSMSDTEETNKDFKKYFWISKQITLFKLISEDIAEKK